LLLRMASMCLSANAIASSLPLGTPLATRRPASTIERCRGSERHFSDSAALNRDVPSELLGPPTNVFRLCLHPDGLARHTLNFPQLASFLLGELHHLRIRTRDQGVESLAKEVLRYPNIETLSRPIPVTTENDPELLIPWKLRLNGVSRSYFITLTKFATPQDITLDELTLELFYPVESGEQEGSRYKGPKAT